MGMLEELNTLLEKIPLWKKLQMLPTRLDAIEKRIKAIEDRIQDTGDVCPFCRQPAGNLIEIKPHPIFGEAGLKVAFYECLKCHKRYDHEINP